jgi:hypothetical protein
MFAILNNVIYLTRGDSAHFDVVPKNPDETVYTPQEGDVITFTAKVSPGRDAVISKTGATITFEPADTANLANSEYIYDIDIKLANGEVNTIVPADGDKPGRLILGVNV